MWTQEMVKTDGEYCLRIKTSKVRYPGMTECTAGQTLSHMFEHWSVEGEVPPLGEGESESPTKGAPPEPVPAEPAVDETVEEEAERETNPDATDPDTE